MKKKLDLNQLAKSIVEQATGEVEPKKNDNKNNVAQKARRHDGINSGKAQTKKK